MIHRSTKTYGHERGLSATYRQHGAKSHCRFLHGYSLAFKFTFEAAVLDECGWVMDFGALRPVKAWLDSQFDHTTLVSDDDPQRDFFLEAQALGLMQVRLVPHTGCEAFAHMAWRFVEGWLETGYGPRVRLVSVEVSEHGANSAIVCAEDMPVG